MRSVLTDEMIAGPVQWLTLSMRRVVLPDWLGPEQEHAAADASARAVALGLGHHEPSLPVPDDEATGFGLAGEQRCEVACLGQARLGVDADSSASVDGFVPAGAEAEPQCAGPDRRQATTATVLVQ